MAKNHYSTKRNRRPISGKRQDTQRAASTMAKLKQLAKDEKSREQKGILAPVRLNNGSEEARALVAVVMLALKNLFTKQPIVFYELVMVCRDDKHIPFGMTAQILKDNALMNQFGGVHDSIRNVVLSATTGDGLDMSLRSPIALPEHLQAEVEALRNKKDEDIDTSDIPEVTDWSGAEVGKFYRG